MLNARFDVGLQTRTGMGDALLSLKGLEVRRGMGVVLDGFSLDVHSGDVVVLQGVNGSGKSTVLESAARLLPLEKGSVHHGSTMVVDFEGRRHMPSQPFGLTLQSNGMIGDETVEDHLQTVCALSDMTADLTGILSSYGLEHRRHDRIAHLSGGQKRKVAVLAGLLPAMISSEPRLIMLDEPDTGLDDNAIASLVSNIAQLRMAGHGFLIASHHATILDCATRLHDLDGETGQTQDDDVVWEAIGTQSPASFLSTRVGHRYMRHTRAGLARNGLTGVIVVGVLLTLFNATSVEDQLWLVGMVLAVPFAVGLSGDPVVYILREHRAIDWWRAHVNRLPSADLIGPMYGVVSTGLCSLIFLNELRWDLVFIGTAVLWASLTFVRFIELSTVRLARPNAAFVRLLVPILILPWGLLVDYAASL